MLSELELANIILKKCKPRILKDGTIDVLWHDPGTAVWIESVKEAYMYVNAEKGFIQMSGSSS